MKIRYPKTIIFIMVLAMIIAGAVIFTPASDQPASPGYSLHTLKRGDLTATVSATGTVKPLVTVQVGSQVSGTIQNLYADFNSQVHKGDVIAQIDAALFKARLAEAQASLKSAEAARDKARVEVLDARRKMGRIEELRKQNLVSESEVDAARFEHEAATVEHQVMSAAVEQAEAVRNREQVNLAYTTIYAPIDGVVISRDVDVGQTVAASLQAPTLFTIARDLERMQIETDVDEAFIGMIEQQQSVTFTVFAYPERKFSGRVAQVRLNPTVEAGVVKYNSIIHVDNEDLALKPGMTATVAIEVAHRSDVFKVPNAALRYVPDWPDERLKQLRAELKGNEAMLWIPDGDDLKPLKVRMGIAAEDETEVIADELQEGMEIVVPGSREENKVRRRFGLSLF
ncbi:MAG TPA: efflux RND transporter periplasmic adaptor subunit [Gammaproteobacteria bacterium]